MALKQQRQFKKSNAIVSNSLPNNYQFSRSKTLSVAGNTHLSLPAADATTANTATAVNSIDLTSNYHEYDYNNYYGADIKPKYNMPSFDHGEEENEDRLRRISKIRELNAIYPNNKFEFSFYDLKTNT